ncbi:MAG: T9SS type A sorting domain-containing protein, partial [Candidatus Eisenbacteria bacterium]|nr:T9SS type A sorting domain-containing protein [Candidatus Eisenbacteria bacterium]
LPPSASQPWWARVYENGDPDLQGWVENFELLSGGSNYVTDGPVPAATSEGQPTTLWIPYSATSSVPDNNRPMVVLQAGPNPMRGHTKLTLELSEAQEVALSVHDVLGRHIKTLHQGPVGAGQSSWQWDATDKHGAPVVSGKYFLRIDTQRSRHVSSITVLR